MLNDCFFIPFMHITINLVSTIFCSIQKLIEDDNNIKFTNKRKFTNEKDITLEHTSIKKYNDFSNEELTIKKQKRIEDQMENNYNHKDCNFLKVIII